MKGAELTEPKPIVDYGQRCMLCRNDAAASRVLCWRHIDEMSDMLDVDNAGRALDDLPPSIPVMWAMLDTSPGANGLSERRAPGFESTPPCSLHIVAMRDPRSCAHPVVDEWFSAGANGWPDFTRPHTEDEQAVRSVEKSLCGLVDAVGAEIDVPNVRDGDHDVTSLCEWLHAHVTLLSRLPWADDVYRDLRDLRDQLRAGIGEHPPRALGYCTNDIITDRETGESGPCGHALYPPAGAKPMARDEPVRDVPVVVCTRCHARYDGLAQLRLRIAELKGTA